MSKEKRFASQTCINCGFKHDPKMGFCPKCSSTKENLARHNNPLEWVNSRKCLGIIASYLVVSLIIPLIALFILAFAMGGNPEANITALSNNVKVNSIMMLISMGLNIVVIVYLLRNYIKAFIHSLQGGKSLLKGLIAGVALFLISWGISALTSLIPGVGENDNQAMLMEEIKSFPLLFVLTTVILAPILEELVFRVGVYGLFRKYNKVVAYVVSAVLFALIHTNFSSGNMVNELAALPDYLIGGFGMAFIYDKFGLGGSVVAHATNNGLASIIMFVVIAA